MREKGDLQPLINCQVSPSIFSSERSVLVDLPDEVPYTAFVDESSVIVDDNGNWRLRIDIRSMSEDSMVIVFPREASTGPQIPTVPLSWAEANIIYMIE